MSRSLFKTYLSSRIFFLGGTIKHFKHFMDSWDPWKFLSQSPRWKSMAGKLKGMIWRVICDENQFEKTWLSIGCFQK